MKITKDEFYTYIWIDGKNVTSITNPTLHGMGIRLPESFTISYEHSSSFIAFCNLVKADGLYLFLKQGHYFCLCEDEFERYFPNLKIPEGVIRELYIYKKEP